MKGITCNKRGYWYVRLEGAKRKCCGHGLEGKANAEALRKEFDAQKQEERAVALGLHAVTEFAMIEDLTTWFMDSPSEQKKSIYRLRLMHYKAIKRHFGHIKIKDLSIEDQENYLIARKKEGAPIISADELGFLRTCYLKAIRNKKIPGDWLPGEWRIVKDFIPRPLIPDEAYEKLLAIASPEFRDCMICGWEGAMRPIEIAFLKVREIFLDIEKPYIGLGKDTKTKMERTVPISTKLKAMLIPRLDGRKPDGWVFDIGRRYHRITKARMSGYSLDFQRLCLKLGLPHGEKLRNDKGEKIGYTFACFRGTRITKLLRAGHTDEIIRKMTGHANLNAYRRYIHLDADDVHGLVD